MGICIPTILSVILNGKERFIYKVELSDKVRKSLL